MKSENLIIRKSTFNDCTFFAEWEIKDYIKKFLTIEETRNYENIVTEFLSREVDDSKEQYTIVLKSENKPIGRVYLAKIDKISDSVDISRIYIGDENYLGKGFGKESMTLLLEYCYKNLNMQRITLDHYPNNEKVSKLYLKLGFKYEGIMRNSAKKNNEYFDLHLMSILKDEYLKLYT